MNALVIDTSSWILYFSGTGDQEIDSALNEGRVYLSPIVAAELMSGRIRPRQEKQLVALLRELPLIECALDHWVRVGKLRSNLAAKGFKVSTPDAHIAQSALDLDCYLLTEDRIFKKIAGAISLRLFRSS